MRVSVAAKAQAEIIKTLICRQRRIGNLISSKAIRQGSERGRDLNWAMKARERQKWRENRRRAKDREESEMRILREKRQSRERERERGG